MADDLDFFLKPDDQRNFALLVEGTKVYVSREFLACWSPVFAKIFFPEGAPFAQPEGGMEMKEKRLEGFLIFLRFLCPSPQYSKMKISVASVAPLLSYADEYDVGVLRERCAKFICEQLKMNNLDEEVLIDYLRLATLYNLKDMQAQLVPLVADLPFCQIKAAHSKLPLGVLAAVYQAKALKGAKLEEGKCGCKGELPKDVFECSGCDQSCVISGGATEAKPKSSCCTVAVRVLPSVAAEALLRCAFVCDYCDKPCTVEQAGDGDYQKSSCCEENVCVQLKCKHQPAGAAPNIVGFSDDLLEEKKA